VSAASLSAWRPADRAEGEPARDEAVVPHPLKASPAHTATPIDRLLRLSLVQLKLILTSGFQRCWRPQERHTHADILSDLESSMCVHESGDRMRYDPAR